MNILIVDDCETNRKLLRAQLEAEDHSVLEACDGVEAMEALESQTVDGIVSDVLMPRMDGYGLCRTVRRHPKLAPLPLLLYTSTYDSASDRQLASAIGADQYIVKPAPARVILDALREAGKKRRPAIPQAQPPDDSEVLKQYSETLIRKLEEKNTALQESMEKLERAHDEILELNRSLERRVAGRTAELEAANKELEAFSYSVSHDLRAPLRHIDGFVNLLRDSAGGTLSKPSRRYLDIIAESARDMGRLIDDLLLFSRAGRAELKVEPVDLAALVAETIESLAPETAGRNILWERHTLPTVQGDPSMLRQVFANLLSNAVKYTGPRDPAKIEVGTVNGAPGEVVIRVCDNGVGFDMEYAGKLFGVFQRLHSDDEFEGTGVGLANVRRIIARHGGCTWAEATVNAGAAFFVSLPHSSEFQP